MRKICYFLVEGNENSLENEWVFDNFPTCFAGLYTFLFLMLIKLEMNNEITLFCVIIGIHILFFSPEQNWNIKGQKGTWS